jgi:hypothetical protein
MSETAPAHPRISSPRTTPPGPSARRRLDPWDVLVLSAWCGLAAGWLEVGTRILCRHIDATNRLYMMSRHFVWLVPLADLMRLASARTRGLGPGPFFPFWPDDPLP